MKIILLPIILIILTSCGAIEKFAADNIFRGNKQLRINTSTDPVFDKYVQSFENHARSILSDSNFLVGDIPVNFGDTGSPDYKGVCVTYGDGKKEVLVEKAWWDSASILHQESLIFHELGHCRLDRIHDNSMLTNALGTKIIKATMMNEFIINPGNYSTYQTEYITELFTKDISDLGLSFGI